MPEIMQKRQISSEKCVVPPKSNGKLRFGGFELELVYFYVAERFEKCTSQMSTIVAASYRLGLAIPLFDVFL